MSRTPKGFRGFDPHSLRQFDPIVQWTEPAASTRLIQVRLLFGSPPSGPLAQWSEPASHNSQGAGSSPAGPILFRRRKPVRLNNNSRCFDGMSPIFWQSKSRAPKAPCRGPAIRAKMAHQLIGARSRGLASRPFHPMDNQNPVDSGQPATVNLDSRIGSRQHVGSL